MNTVLSLPFRLTILAVAVAVWLVIFFTVKRFQAAPRRRLDSSIPLDHKTPFVPQMALVYFSTYVFVVLPFVLLSEARLFWAILGGYAAVTAIATALHAALPSQVQRVEDLAAYGFSGWTLGLFQKICKPYGNFPSMHVAFSVLAVGASYLWAGPVAGSLALVWAILIALSTLFAKQHYILDVLGGVLIGSLVFASVFWLALV
ncbi:MAG: phosphatase PAP2 family protein [Chloroflexota bacterium]